MGVSKRSMRCLSRAPRAGISRPAGKVIEKASWAFWLKPFRAFLLRPLRLSRFTPLYWVMGRRPRPSSRSRLREVREQVLRRHRPRAAGLHQVATDFSEVLGHKVEDKVNQERVQDTLTQYIMWRLAGNDDKENLEVKSQAHSVDEERRGP